jgi:hypothetical protein
MLRNFSALLALVVTAVATAGDPPRLPQSLPHGTWRLDIDDGSSWTLTLDDKGAKWVGSDPDPKGMTVTWIAPVCGLTEDGKTLYGYMTQMTWVRDWEIAHRNGVEPFAFAFKADGDSLQVSNFKATGIEPKWFPWIAGTYRKVLSEEPAQDKSRTVAVDLPKGTWRRTVAEGFCMTLTLDGKGAKWFGQGPMGSATTITWVAPVCTLGDDGKIVRGYVARTSWVNDEETSDRNGVMPYAFTLKIAGDSLEVTDFKMAGVDPRYFQCFNGRFSTVPAEETAQTPQEPATMER